jgi:hypothetical protein
MLFIVVVIGLALESSVKQWFTLTSPYLGDTYEEWEWGPPSQTPTRGAPDCKLAVKSCSLRCVSCKQPPRDGRAGPTRSRSIRQLTTVDRIMWGMPHGDVTSTKTPPASTHARTPRRLALPLREWRKRECVLINARAPITRIQLPVIVQFQATTSTWLYETDGVEVKERLSFMVSRNALLRRTLQTPPLIPPQDYKIGSHLPSPHSPWRQRIHCTRNAGIISIHN